MHSSSDIDAILLLGVTSIHSLPIRTTGQDFLHSCLHLFGLHLSELTIAIRVNLSVSSVAFLRDIALKFKFNMLTEIEARNLKMSAYIIISTATHLFNTIMME